MSVQLAACGNIATLTSLKNLLEQLPDSLYTSAIGQNEYSVGEQVRHILEHYQTLFEGLAKDCISYDDRKRDRRIEQSTEAAIRVLNDTLPRLDKLREEVDRSLSLVAVVTKDDPSSAITTTSLQRELLFVQCHTIHHLAILKILLRDQSVVIPKEFGQAPATQHFHNRSAPTVLATGAE